MQRCHTVLLRRTIWAFTLQTSKDSTSHLITSWSYPEMNLRRTFRRMESSHELPGNWWLLARQINFCPFSWGLICRRRVEIVVFPGIWKFIQEMNYFHSIHLRLTSWDSSSHSVACLADQHISILWGTLRKPSLIALKSHYSVYTKLISPFSNLPNLITEYIMRST